MILALGITLLVVGTLAIVSGIHHQRVRNFLLKPLVVDAQTRKEVSRKFNLQSEELAVVGVSTFDVLYNTARMDPFALAGMEHLHHAQSFDSMADLTSFMKETIIKSPEGSKAWEQMIDKYKGYTGEELHFDRLRDAGQNIVIPESATNTHWDYMSDGIPHNVAITNRHEYIADKLRELPSDIVIDTTPEMKAYFPNDSRVVGYDHLSEVPIEATTDSAFDGIDDLGDFIDGVPYITLAISATRNYQAVKQGDKDVGRAIEHATTDTIGIGVGGWAGAKVGLGLGLVLAPFTAGTSAIIIPAIATTLGALIGAMSGRGVSQWWKERHLREAVEILNAEALRFGRTFLTKVNQLVSRISSDFEEKKNKCNFAKKQLQNWFMRVLFPKPLTKFYTMAVNRLQGELNNTKAYYAQLVEKMKRMPGHNAGLLLYAQDKSALANDTDLLVMRNYVGTALEKVEKEKRALR